jgi:hypothetical protein
MSKALSNAAILTKTSEGASILTKVAGSILLEAMVAGEARINMKQAALLAEGVGVLDLAIREALGIEVERLDVQAKGQGAGVSVEDFLKARRQNQEKVARAFSEQRDEAGFQELKGMADQPANQRETVDVKFVPIGRISLPADATPSDVVGAILNLLGQHPDQGRPTTH